jgi:hypothetical protein
MEKLKRKYYLKKMKKRFSKINFSNWELKKDYAEKRWVYCNRNLLWCKLKENKQMKLYLVEHKEEEKIKHLHFINV